MEAHEYHTLKKWSINTTWMKAVSYLTLQKCRELMFQWNILKMLLLTLAIIQKMQSLHLCSNWSMDLQTWCMFVLLDTCTSLRNSGSAHIQYDYSSSLNATVRHMFPIKLFFSVFCVFECKNFPLRFIKIFHEMEHSWLNIGKIIVRVSAGFLF